MLCLSVDEIGLPFHHSSFQLLHSSFHFCSFLKVTCEPSDRVKKMNQPVKLLTQTLRTNFFSVFAASFMIHSHGVSPCTNRYVAFWWFTRIISKWILSSNVINFAATADVGFLRLPSCSRGCQIHQECRLLILTPNGHPFPWAPTHRHTGGLPASPRYLFLSRHNPNASPLCSVKETEHICRFWVVNSSHREAPHCRAPRSTQRHVKMWLCAASLPTRSALPLPSSPGALAFPALPLRPSVSHPIHSSRSPETLLSVYFRITAFVCFKCDSCFIHLPSVEAMR